jgi:hypothetical protein
MAKKPQQTKAPAPAPIARPKVDRAAQHKRRMEKRARKALKTPRGTTRRLRRAHEQAEQAQKGR